MDLKAHIRGIPDFPKPGILFYDIATLLRDADAWQVAMGRMARVVRKHQPDLIAGIESRGFLIAAPLALGAGLLVAFLLSAEIGARRKAVVCAAALALSAVTLLPSVIPASRFRAADEQVLQGLISGRW